MTTLNAVQRRHLRSLAHQLHPVVMIGDAGLSEAVMREIDLSLKAHELIKIRVLGDDRDARIAMLDRICADLNAAPVQHIGKLLLVYRPGEKPKLTLPK
ncbi:ribosome assembly RNA-binding protein YhbY [Sulfuriferula thiophila]|uniref:ribosome assembly RNA-binding protein YhbY n=1 Tax=Sulfuriferula thiophila TaxID=1781211 RepID=UPI000F60AE30|nr:ribosome assembly RNA-binding protein YhbY [Sulfuriferula thiophila]